MNGTFRQSMSWLHTWAGLTLGWILYFIFVTGTASYFDTEIDRWMMPEIPVYDHDRGQTQMLGTVERYLERKAPDTPHWYISFPDQRYPFLAVGWRDGGNRTQVDYLDPETGTRLAPRDTEGGQALVDMHFELHYLPHELADWLVSLSTLFMFVALLTGIVIHRKIFKDFFTFRPGKGQRSWLDLHNLFSVLSLPFQLMITYSGLLFFMYITLPGIDHFTPEEENAMSPDRQTMDSTASVYPLSRVFGQVEKQWGENDIAWIELDEPGTVEHATVTIARKPQASRLTETPRLRFDRVNGELLSPSSEELAGPQLFHRATTGLHTAHFAKLPLRWLFFLSGLLGTGMIATGLILWAAKRRTEAGRTGRTHPGLRLVERLNAGTIAGLPIGIAVYFWANRLLPLTMQDRAHREILAMFASWGLCFAYASIRPLKRAWIELTGLASVCFLLLPLLNYLTTDRHLVNSIAQRDWVMAGFDLTVAALGLLLALGVWKLSSRERASQVTLTGRPPQGSKAAEVS